MKVLQDCFGFLRSPDAKYLPAPAPFSGFQNR
jgi:hypothetical protein